MDPKQIVLLAFQVSIAATVFGFGLAATRDELMFLWRRPQLFIRSLIAVLIVMPAFAILLVRVFHFRPVVEVALLALAISPMPPLLPRRMHKGGGEDAYGISLLLWLSLVALVAVPLARLILSAWLGPEVLSSGKIAKVLLLMVVLPLVAGAFLRSRWPAIADRIDRPIKLGAMVLLAMAVVVLLAVAWRPMWNAVGDGTIFAVVLFVVVGLAVGHFLGGPSRDTSVVLALATACRHPVVALTIASSSAPGSQFGGTILLYVLIASLVATPYLMYQHRCETPPPKPKVA
ncbi:hypothetical protein LVB87_11850 [Lysobacter sp. KIS68-7]|uniref:bile acid:sodium symporter family protein n=1 Tax=Lysobacter sp. KIS68-7 TaxID=2904252 RepID=UPI001E5ABD97|nr:hypothetical protein [Lysobacter sp. KIS68-7]UHQ18874.1 hypothetical protein LVB87_11850 [Lysobacter sp. KIS68-7]